MAISILRKVREMVCDDVEDFDARDVSELELAIIPKSAK